jgi:DNA (cytosine-5)-methyltransferase 1
VATDYKDPQMICYGVDCYNQTQTEEVSKALNSAATDSDHIPCVYGIDRASFNQGQNAQYDFSITEEQAQTLVARGPGGVLSRQSVPYAQETIKE